MGRGLPLGLTQRWSRSREQAQPCGVPHPLFHTPVGGGAVRRGCVGLGRGQIELSSNTSDRHGGCDLWEEVDYQEERSWQPPETPKSSHGGKGSRALCRV